MTPPIKPENPPPDQGLAEHPTGYSDPELRAYTDDLAQDILEEVIHLMPIVLPAVALAHIFMFGLISVWLG